VASWRIHHQQTNNQSIDICVSAILEDGRLYFLEGSIKLCTKLFVEMQAEGLDPCSPRTFPYVTFQSKDSGEHASPSRNKALTLKT